MIRKDKLKRIIKHLEYYGNTIIMESDFKGDSLDTLIHIIENEGWEITELTEGRKVNTCQDHYVIRAKRRENVKRNRKTKSIEA